MPVYFFNVRDGEEVHIDHTGQDLADDMAAWHEAATRAESSIRDLDGWPHAGASRRVEVIGENGRLLCSVEAIAYGKT